jgi:LCP family protein required for cell wall assembly
MSDRPGRSRRSPARPKLRNQILFVFGILVLAAGAFYTALVVATQIERIFFPGNPINLGTLARLPGIQSSDSGSTDIGGGRINILVMGIDRRPYEGNILTRSDTMFVVTVDPSAKTARGLAMPRDLFVDIPTKSGGSFKERINTALEYGETSGYSGGGPGLAKATVERLLGLKINHYVIIDFTGFKDVVDLLGGIDVDVPTAIKDPTYSETERLGDFYPCVFDVGIHHMNGSDALCYARTRFNNSDLDRIQRQQRVIFAVMDRASQLKLLSDPTNVTSLWKRYKSAVITDISDFQVPGFARLAAQIDTDHLAFLSLGAATIPYTTPQGAAVLLPSQAGIKQIVEALMSDQRLDQENATVEVQNGTAKAGQEAKIVDYLANQGLSLASVKAAPAVAIAHPKTEIIDFGGKTYTSQRIASLLGLTPVSVRPSTEADATLRTIGAADILVIVGDDARIDTRAVYSP